MDPAYLRNGSCLLEGRILPTLWSDPDHLRNGSCLLEGRILPTLGSDSGYLRVESGLFGSRIRLNWGSDPDHLRNGSGLLFLYKKNICKLQKANRNYNRTLLAVTCRISPTASIIQPGVISNKCTNSKIEGLYRHLVVHNVMHRS